MVAGLRRGYLPAISADAWVALNRRKCGENQLLSSANAEASRQSLSENFVVFRILGEFHHFVSFVHPIDAKHRSRRWFEENDKCWQFRSSTGVNWAIRVPFCPGINIATY